MIQRCNKDRNKLIENTNKPKSDQNKVTVNIYAPMEICRWHGTCVGVCTWVYGCGGVGSRLLGTCLSAMQRSTRRVHNNVDMSSNLYELHPPYCSRRQRDSRMYAQYHALEAVVVVPVFPLVQEENGIAIEVVRFL